MPEQFDGPGFGLGGTDVVVIADHLDDLTADAHQRVERARGLLEDHARRGTAQRPQFAVIGPDDLPAGDDGAAVHVGGGAEQSQCREGHRALARAGFADESEGFAGVDVQ